MSDKKIFLLSLILVFISFINFIFIFFNILYVENYLNGYASAYVNLTILSSASINLTVNSIDWGFGTINSSETNATLYTIGNQTGVVIRGNWSGQNARGFVLENIGNVNCSLFIQNDKTAHQFFNSSSNTNEEYMLNVTNKEVNSCSNTTILGVFRNVNITSPGTNFCSNFTFLDTQDEIYIDILLTVPFDAGYSGERSDNINILCV